MKLKARISVYACYIAVVTGLLYGTLNNSVHMGTKGVVVAFILGAGMGVACHCAFTASLFSRRDPSEAVERSIWLPATVWFLSSCLVEGCLYEHLFGGAFVPCRNCRDPVFLFSVSNMMLSMGGYVALLNGGPHLFPE